MGHLGYHLELVLLEFYWLHVIACQCMLCGMLQSTDKRRNSMHARPWLGHSDACKGYYGQLCYMHSLCWASVLHVRPWLRLQIGSYLHVVFIGRVPLCIESSNNKNQNQKGRQLIGSKLVYCVMVFEQGHSSLTFYCFPWIIVMLRYLVLFNEIL